MKESFKYYIKKGKWAIVASIIIALLTIVIGSASDHIGFYENSEMHADSYTINAEILSNGDLVIDEFIAMESEEDMHVVFHDIVYGKNNAGKDDNKSSFNKNVKVEVYDALHNLLISSEQDGKVNRNVTLGYSFDNDKDELGERITCPSNYGSECESIFSYVNKGTFPLTYYHYIYTIEGAVTVFNDVAELNWIFIDDTGMQINDAVVNLKYPYVNNTDDVYFFGHSSSNAKLDKLSNDSVTFSTKLVKPREKLEVRLLLPTEVFINARNEYEDKYLSDVLALEEENNIKNDAKDNLISILLLIALIADGLLGLLAFYLIYQKYDKEFKPEFTGEYYRELPAEYTPAEMSYLYRFKELKDADISATLLDLIVKGFIDIEYADQSVIDKKADYTMKLNKNKDQSELLSHEKYLLKFYFETISKNKETVTIKEVEKFAKSTSGAEQYIRMNNKWLMLAKKEGGKHDFFDKSSENLVKTKIWIPVVYIMITVIIYFYRMFIGGRFVTSIYLAGLSLIIGILLLTYIKLIKRRSKSGNEDYVKWKAFKNYLLHFGNFKEQGMPSIIIWEKYLVYATSFGVADLVEKQMKIKFKDLKIDARTYNRYPLFRYPYFYHYYNMRIINASSIARTTMSRNTAQQIGRSFPSGGRGGFSGGSSFGGGGGGFRGR